MFSPNTKGAIWTFPIQCSELLQIKVKSKLKVFKEIGQKCSMKSVVIIYHRKVKKFGDKSLIWSQTYNTPVKTYPKVAKLSIKILFSEYAESQVF